MDPRPLTSRERAVLDALLAVVGAEVLRGQAAGAMVVGTCPCGCPSVDFRNGAGRGMTPRVDATVAGSFDTLFLYTVHDPHDGEVLGGIEWAGIDDISPPEFPPPTSLHIRPA